MFHLDLQKAHVCLQMCALNEAEKVGKYGYEMAFPHYIVAVGRSSHLHFESQDEPGSWRSRRSTSRAWRKLDVNVQVAALYLGPQRSLPSHRPGWSERLCDPEDLLTAALITLQRRATVLSVTIVWHPVNKINKALL